MRGVGGKDGGGEKRGGRGGREKGRRGVGGVGGEDGGGEKRGGDLMQNENLWGTIKNVKG